MAGYHGRRGPDVSHLVSTLNTAPQPYDQGFQPADDINLDQELELFTNTTFVDFDNLGQISETDLGYGVDGAGISTSPSFRYQDLLPEGTTSPQDAGGANIPYFQPYASPDPPPPTLSKHDKAVENSSSIDRPLILPDLPPQLTSTKPQADADTTKSPAENSIEQQSRLAAEEDKRRRNTAASARFRVKKKQREQALEKTVRDVNDKNRGLEARIRHLEVENRWLKNLLTEKNGKQTEDELVDAYQTFRRDSEDRETAERSKQKQGIGTKG